MPAWIDGTVWWHVYPLGFVGAPKAAGVDEPVVARLDHLTAWLDYVAELGATGLALGPIFAAATHGYDTTDHLRIDPRLGDDAAFDRLVAALKARGMRLLLDGVFNHVGRDHPLFRQAVAEGPDSSAAAFFRLTWPGGWVPGVEPDHACFEGHRALVALNHDAPVVAELVGGAMDHWSARGADGWRLDAAYAVPRRFWADVLPRWRAAHREGYVVGEVIHGDYPAIVRAAGFDAVTQYELWKAIWSALNDRNLFELAWALDRHGAFLDAFVPLTFVGNHDVTRIASRLADPRHLPHALAVLFATGGTPSVYAGDEQGFRGVKEDREGGDDAVRPAFPAEPGALPPAGAPVFRLHRELVVLRRRHPWLARARTARVSLANGHAVFESRAGEFRLHLALNLTDAAVDLTVPGAVRIEAGDGTLSRDGAPNAAVALPRHGWAILA